MTDKGCPHNNLVFGSGDYYVICSDCKRYWVMIGNNGDEADASLSNIGCADWSGVRTRQEDK